MPMLRWSLLLLLVALANSAGQTMTVASRLGYPANAKLLILHGDDLGVAHSVNAASLDALERGAISSASIMMPTPWVTEVCAWAKAHPDADLGLHLTLTSEWETFRWGSVESKDVTGRVFENEGGMIVVADGWNRGPQIDKGAKWEPSELGPVIADLLAKADPAFPVHGT